MFLREFGLDDCSVIPTLPCSYINSLLSQNFGASFGIITTTRGTGSYHGVMALIMFIGYAILIVNNIHSQDKISIPRILAIGILVQFSWEAVLLITNIRRLETMPIIINSLIETNLGLPYLFIIHRAISKKRNENLTLRDDTK